MPSQEIVQHALQRFYALFSDELSVDDHIEFACNHITPRGDTSLLAKTYQAEKLSRVVMEEYCIKGAMRGTVIMAFPKPDNDVPIFFFQLGGKGDRAIAVLDLCPTLAHHDMAPLVPVYEKYRELLGLEPTKVDWMTKVCSPLLLSCQYDELNCELFIEAMEAYLQVWRKHYYTPARTLSDPNDIEIVSNAIYKFKYVLHHYDPAYEIFAKSWGRSAADTFVDLECGDYPAYSQPEPLGKKIRRWENRELNVLWTEDAQRRAMQEPEAIQPTLREQIEAQISADNFGIITPDLYDRYKPQSDTTSG